MDDEEEKEKARRTVFERCEHFQKSRSLSLISHFNSCQELVADMVHTKDGSRAVREFLAWGTAKVAILPGLPVFPSSPPDSDRTENK
jgi:hypothetical protein